jgi:hypothetical protein
MSLLLLVLALLVLMLAAAMPAFAGQEKSAVCHMTGTYDFGQGDVPAGHLITIADPALDSHIDHGDTQTYVEKKMKDGEVVCTAEEEVPPLPPYTRMDDSTLLWDNFEHG